MFRKKAQKGVSLLETLVAGSIGLIIVVSLIAYYRSSYRFKYYLKLRSTQETIAAEIASRLQSPSTIYTSVLYTGNTAIRDCLLGMNNGCTAVHTLPSPNNDSPSEFSNLVPFSLASKEGFGAIQVFTDKDSPVYYDHRGARGCQKRDESCLFEVQTSFFATCPKKNNIYPDSCLFGAEYVHFAYMVTQIRQGNGYKPITLGGAKLEMELAPLPPQLYVTSMPVSTIFGSISYDDCRQGSRITGFSSKGVAACECIRPYRQRNQEFDNLGRPICELMTTAQLRCGPNNNQLFRGPNADGTAHCVNADDAFECRAITSYNKTFMSGTCGAGEWVQNFFRTGCKLHCQFGKDGEQCLSRDNDGVRNALGMVVYNGQISNDMCGTFFDPAIDFASSTTQKIPNCGRNIFHTYVAKGLICDTQVLYCCKNRNI